MPRVHKTDLVVITRFRWSADQLISKVTEDEETETAQTWIRGTKPLFMASGHKSTLIGHLREDTSKVYLFTSWEDMSFYDAFKASPDYSPYLTALSIHGPISSTQIAEFRPLRGPPIGITEPAHISLRTIYYKSNISEEEKTAAFQLTGYITRHSTRIVEEFALVNNWTSWLQEEEEFDGFKAKAMIVAYWWKSWDSYDAYTQWREPEWESSPRYNSDGTVAVQETVGMTHTEVWDKKLLARGALGWEDERIELLLFPMEPWFVEWQRKKHQDYEDSLVYASC